MWFGTALSKLYKNSFALYQVFMIWSKWQVMLMILGNFNPFLESWIDHIDDVFTFPKRLTEKCCSEVEDLGVIYHSLVSTPVMRKTFEIEEMSTAVVISILLQCLRCSGAIHDAWLFRFPVLAHYLVHMIIFESKESTDNSFVFMFRKQYGNQN